MRFSYYLARRLLYTILVLFGLSILIFIIARTLPGDPARRIWSVAARPGGRPRLLTEFSALNPGAAQQFAVLLLRHALAPLLDD